MMRYDYSWLEKCLKEGEELHFIYFWGQHPGKDGKIGKSCLSQWFESIFEHKGIRYFTAEQWMMAEKARLFGDQENLEKILKAISPEEVKSLGRKVKDFDEEIWEKNRDSIVKNGNYLKFKQNTELKEYILSTGMSILVEASPYDKIWGIGMKEGEPGIEEPNNWKGLNLLGYSLMEVRDKLREEK